VLRACYEALRPGGRTAFYVLAVRAGLSRKDQARLAALGGRGVFADRTYRELLARAGFALLRERDVTARLRATLSRWIAERRRHEASLLDIEGAATFRGDTQYLERRLIAIDEGLIERMLYVAAREDAP
jgi:hypothetical protein